MKHLIAKKMKSFKKDLAVSSCYAAVSSILASSSKLGALLPLAARVVEAMKKASRLAAAAACRKAKIGLCS